MNPASSSCTPRVRHSCRTHKRHNCLNDGTSGPQAPATHLSVSAQSSHGSAQELTPSSTAETQEARGLVWHPGQKPEPYHGVLKTRKPGRSCGKVVLEQRTTPQMLSPSRRPAPQTACSGSGPRLPKEKVKRVQPERVHSERHGWVWGESITTSHPLAEDKAWRYKALVPTPTLAAAQTPGHALTGHRKQGCCTS